MTFDKHTASTANTQALSDSLDRHSAGDLHLASIDKQAQAALAASEKMCFDTYPGMAKQALAKEIQTPKTAYEHPTCIFPPHSGETASHVLNYLDNKVNNKTDLTGAEKASLSTLEHAIVGGNWDAIKQVVESYQNNPYQPKDLQKIVGELKEDMKDSALDINFTADKSGTSGALTIADKAGDAVKIYTDPAKGFEVKDPAWDKWCQQHPEAKGQVLSEYQQTGEVLSKMSSLAIKGIAARNGLKVDPWSGLPSPSFLNFDLIQKR